MYTAIILAILAALGVWFVVARSVWRSGPGRRKYSTECPENGLAVKVTVDQKEGDFGSLVKADVLQCSLFSPGPPNCGKECLGRL